MVDFELWLEFEEVDPENWDREVAFANIEVALGDGRRYGLNVWTFEFFVSLTNNKAEVRDNYIAPPDLFVKYMTRECIEEAIGILLLEDDLEKALNPSILINPE
ncbi:hypothetical protein BXY85_2391 [Roseivirga pacifica]|uniref:Uncharacterized protein n=1 Tax=Roseivirga pacifica TaxID=1267423 RepID=A0A1I0NPR8_9BACT|nr:hypothetical protein [Roseivirga pacifica]RKQ51366.1 hypothetical protein BXY85_2391 [Roseivirga pacifica]SEW03546.1 hypothetical protein SAMN05216290_1373 [Roseivirga pacifica]